MTLRSVNPATGETLATYEDVPRDGAFEIVAATHAAWLDWRRTSTAARAEHLTALAEALDQRTERCARLMAMEMGKPVRQGRAEIEKCAWLCRHQAEHGPDVLADEPVSTEAAHAFVSYRPLGVVLGVMPWNFPYWQVFRFAVPALLAGNAVLLKHASNVMGCALDIETLMFEAGLPRDLFRVLPISSDLVPAVLERDEVVAASVTGSTEAGRAVAAAAGGCVKKSVLELGGSDPYVILEDADVEAAARTCVESRLTNGGQSCIAAKRFVVVRSVLEPFTEAVLEELRRPLMGDPLLDAVDVGPQARHDLRDALHDQVERSVEGGARLLLGGEIPDEPGAFYPPSLLADVKPGTPAREEELFGPVAAVIPVEDEDEAVRAANASCFGLGAAVFTADVQRGLALARDRIDAGTCVVNAMVKSDPRLPFGGIKRSGYGRELAVQGLREFVNVKTVLAEDG